MFLIMFIIIVVLSCLLIVGNYNFYSTSNTPQRTEPIIKDIIDIKCDIRTFVNNKVVSVEREVILIGPQYSSSMTPTIGEYSNTLCYRDFTKEELIIGTIVIYEPKNTTGWKTYTDKNIKLIGHRIVDITDDGKYIFKGDNNPSADPFLVDFDEVFCIIGATFY